MEGEPAQETRLSIYRLLVEAGPDGVACRRATAFAGGRSATLLTGVSGRTGIATCRKGFFNRLAALFAASCVHVGKQPDQVGSSFSKRFKIFIGLPARIC